jgi:membrane-bound serine protease (ClpP class)
MWEGLYGYNLIRMNHMKIDPRIVVLIALALVSFLLPAPARSQADTGVLLLETRGPLTPAMVEYLSRGIARAEDQEMQALIFQIDTPGGSIDLMNRMVQEIRASEVPVIVYVAPRGAIAGSAGTVITLAGHVAVMAPETAIGAASPVGGQGEDLGETIEAKEKEILKATTRGLAARRGDEAVALAEATIEDAKAVSADEALAAGLIDFVVADVDELLQAVDGYELPDRDGERLQTVGAQVTELPQRFIERFLQVLTNPNIVFLLITVGVQALLIEISAPGGWVAGFIGVVCLALGVYGLGILPVNWFGLIFIVTAFVLFFLEVKVPTYGALSVAGLASFIIGALVLFNSAATPSFLRVSIPLVVGTGIATAAFFTVIVAFAVRAQMKKPEVGRDALVGRSGRTRSDLAPSGMVHVAGELWTASSKSGETIPADTNVMVVGVDGLRLEVEPKDNPTS